MSTKSRLAGMRPLKPNGVMPLVILKTTEGQRLEQYIRYVDQTWDPESWKTYAMEPWRMDDYCAISAYSNCTQFIGNMPIGDETVFSYTFPGAIDEYARRHTEDPVLDHFAANKTAHGLRSEGSLAKPRVENSRQSIVRLGHWA